VCLSSDVVNDGTRVSGIWSEASRGISGTLQAHSNSGRISAVADAAGFSANLNLMTRGDQQSVSIVPGRRQRRLDHHDLELTGALRWLEIMLRTES
jgi:hypothetical protein